VRRLDFLRDLRADGAQLIRHARRDLRPRRHTVAHETELRPQTTHQVKQVRPPMRHRFAPAVHAAHDVDLLAHEGTELASIIRRRTM
jgi:hypothetical protein